jgi:hypothetical protein
VRLLPSSNTDNTQSAAGLSVAGSGLAPNGAPRSARNAARIRRSRRPVRSGIDGSNQAAGQPDRPLFKFQERAREDLNLRPFAPEVVNGCFGPLPSGTGPRNDGHSARRGERFRCAALPPCAAKNAAKRVVALSRSDGDGTIVPPATFVA